METSKRGGGGGGVSDLTAHRAGPTGGHLRDLEIGNGTARGSGYCYRCCCYDTWKRERERESLFWFILLFLDSGKRGSGEKGKLVDGFSDLNPG